MDGVTDYQAITAQLQAMLERAEKTTSGPWSRNRPTGSSIDGFLPGVVVAATYGRQMIFANPPGGSFPKADCDFIVSARTEHPALVRTLLAVLPLLPKSHYSGSYDTLSCPAIRGGNCNCGYQASIDAIAELQRALAAQPEVTR